MHQTHVRHTRVRPTTHGWHTLVPLLTFGTLWSGPHIVAEAAVPAEVEHAVSGAVGQTAAYPLVRLLAAGAHPAGQTDAHALGAHTVTGTGRVGAVRCRQHTEGRSVGGDRSLARRGTKLR